MINIIYNKKKYISIYDNNDDFTFNVTGIHIFNLNIAIYCVTINEMIYV